MKIGFPLHSLKEKTMTDDLHGCKKIGVFNYATKELTEVDVDEFYAQTKQNNLLSLLNLLEVKVMVCNTMKPVALKYFNDMHITVYKAESDRIDLNLDLLFDGQLKRFQSHMASPASCGSSCSSCTSNSCSTR